MCFNDLRHTRQSVRGCASANVSVLIGLRTPSRCWADTDRLHNPAGYLTPRESSCPGWIIPLSTWLLYLWHMGDFPAILMGIARAAVHMCCRCLHGHINIMHT